MSERLERVVAHRGQLSRKQAGRAIRKGRVTVDGELVRVTATAIDDGAVVELDGIVLVRAPILAMWNKPSGVQCTIGDPYGRESLESEAADLLELGLHPVGRLDADTSGLLLFSADGQITQRLLHPKRAVERVYVARVDPPPTPDLVDVLAAGVQTADGVCKAEVHSIEEDVVTLGVREGRNRMVRRMLANSGHPVVELKRIRFGEHELGDLPEGEWREISVERPR